MISWTVLALVLGVTARITRFVNTDILAGPLRAATIRRFGADSRQVEWVRCAWCLSVWVAAAVTALAYTATHAWDSSSWFTAPAVALGVSWVYSMIAQRLDTN